LQRKVYCFGLLSFLGWFVGEGEYKVYFQGERIGGGVDAWVFWGVLFKALKYKSRGDIAPAFARIWSVVG